MLKLLDGADGSHHTLSPLADFGTQWGPETNKKIVTWWWAAQLPTPERSAHFLIDSLSPFFLCSIQKTLQMHPLLILLDLIRSVLRFSLFFVITKCLIFVLLILNSAARAVVKLIRREIHIIHRSPFAIRTYLIRRPNIQLNIYFYFFQCQCFACGDLDCHN